MNNRVRILSTSDLHGFIYPYSYADRSIKNHGLARIKTLIDSLRDENTILIDNGDTIEGSPFTFYHYLKHQDKICPISLAMKELYYDYVNAGNHDFNYGQKELLKHLQTVNATCITNNVYIQDEEGKKKCLGVPYAIREILGKKIALFGVTTHFVPQWEKPENIEGMEFVEAFEATKRTLELLKAKEQPDYIICVYHGGFERHPETGEPTELLTGENQAYQMLEELEGIDVLIAGHQHRTYCGILHKTAYTESAFSGLYLSCVDIDIDTHTITPQLIEATVEPDSSILQLTQEEENECQNWLDQTLGTTDIDLKIIDEGDARLHKSQLLTFLNLVQMEVTGADISAAALFLRATGFDHNITMRNLVSTYQFPNTLVVKKITGKILREYLEKDMEFWVVKDNKVIINPLFDFPNVQYHNYDMLDGIEYEAKISNPLGQRIISLTRNGKEIKDTDEFTLVVNNYRASGGGNYHMIENAPTIKEYQTTMVDVLANYIMNHKKISFKVQNNIKIGI
ncbi:MAG: bifunctional metallophosphatase/5'-nucleotidase [Solobacterium sp.]|nr:bifunctional metallophosphatase/5'-nucleotidase [Solobacterium sp.]